MMYRATQKQFIILGNYIQNPDKFGSWSVVNYGTKQLTINDTIVLNQGESYSVSLEPNVIFDSAINFKFSGTQTDTARAAVVLIYHKEA